MNRLDTRGGRNGSVLEHIQDLTALGRLATWVAPDLNSVLDEIVVHTALALVWVRRNGPQYASIYSVTRTLPRATKSMNHFQTVAEEILGGGREEVKRLATLGALASWVFDDMLRALGTVEALAAEALSQTAVADPSVADPSVAEPLRNHLQKIGRAAERASEICRMITPWADEPDGEQGLLDLNRLVEEASAICQLEALKRVHFRRQLAGDLPMVAARARLLRRSIRNLLVRTTEAALKENAVTPSVTIRTTYRPARDERTGLWVGHNMGGDSSLFSEGEYRTAVSPGILVASGRQQLLLEEHQGAPGWLVVLAVFYDPLCATVTRGSG